MCKRCALKNLSGLVNFQLRTAFLGRVLAVLLKSTFLCEITYEYMCFMMPIKRCFVMPIKQFQNMYAKERDHTEMYIPFKCLFQVPSLC